MTNFTDDPEKIGRNSNIRRSRNMADAGNEDPQHQKPEEEHQKDETGDEDSATPIEMYLLIWTTHHSAKHSRTDLTGEWKMKSWWSVQS